VRDKLGGYTAGTIKGIEGRRIKAHLKGCESCQSLQGELSEVCSSLRAHAGLLLPVVGLGLTAAVAHTVTGGTAAAAVAGKSMLVATRVKLALTAGSVAAVGVFGITIGPWLSHNVIAIPKFSNDQNEQTYCAPSSVQNQPGQPSSTVVAGPTAAGGGQVLGATEVPRVPAGRSSGHIGQAVANSGGQTVVIDGRKPDDPGWRSIDGGGQSTTVTTDPGTTTTTTDPTDLTTTTPPPTVMVVPVTTTTKPTAPVKPTKPVPTGTDTRKKPPVTTTTTPPPPKTTKTPAPTSTDEGTTGGN
jgi:hypothetical protein